MDPVAIRLFRLPSNPVSVCRPDVFGAPFMKTKHHRLFVQALACFVILLPLFAARAEEPAKPSIPQTQVHGVNAAYVDRTVRPGDEFFEYANGLWLKTVEIPADRTSIALDTALVEQTNKRTADLIAEVAKKGAPAGDESR